MTKKLALLHTVPTLIGPFTELAREILPADLELMHIADEVLLKMILAQGGLSPFIYRRVGEHVAAAEQAGAAAILFTCSSISPCADPARLLTGIPVLKVDEPMIDQALTLGERIGVVATVGTTLKPTSELVQARAEATGKTIHLVARLCEAAYQSLFAGDAQTHDRIVRETITRLMPEVDVILLAQASMARVVATIPVAEQRTPILSSPRPALEQAARILTQVTGGS